jgi:hypothetical protein
VRQSGIYPSLFGVRRLNAAFAAGSTGTRVDGPHRFAATNKAKEARLAPRLFSFFVKLLNLRLFNFLK